MPHRILTSEFFHRPCLEAACELPGKILCRQTDDGSVLRLRILETEAYCGAADTACHAHKGRTSRTEVLYAAPGTLYIYLCYGIHWMLNIVTGEKEDPQAVLVRACENAEGPGKLTRALFIDKSFNGVSIDDCRDSLWIEDDGIPCSVMASARIGIGYASLEDQAREWRFILEKTAE